VSDWLSDAFSRPMQIGRRTFPPVGVVLLAVVGLTLLLVVAQTSWQVGSDELSYWGGGQRLAAGQPLYNPLQAPNTPYAYWYTPDVAQLLAPFTGLIAPNVFTVIWTVFLLGCLWWLAGRDVVVALALIAFLPVAVELRTRNVHLVLAVLAVLALRRSWVFWVIGAAIKITPVLGAVYLVAARRYREALAVVVVGALILGVSVVLAPGAWHDWLAVAVPRITAENGGVVPVPFGLRFAVAFVMAAVAGRMSGRRGEVLMIVALTVGNPTWWVTAFSLLIAIVPIWRTAPRVVRHATAIPGPGPVASEAPTAAYARGQP